MIQNQIKTVILLGLLTGLLLGVGQMIGGSEGLAIALIFSLGLNFLMYWFSDKIVLAIYRAKPIEEKTEPELFNLIKDVAKKASLPMPKVYKIPSEQPNAFATGRNPKHAAVAVTEGILKLLSKEELQGVIAHEMSHVKNRDTLITTVAATIAGVISYIAAMARWTMFFGGRDDDNNAAEILVLAILTPLIATLLQLALSRSREYLADETAAKMLKNSHGLAGALNKLKLGIPNHPMGFGNETTSALFIANPFKGGVILNLLSTHPPLDERISRLKKMRI